MAKLEGPFQTELRKEIKRRWPDAIVSKQDSAYQQGIPDLAIFFDGGFYALLEVKRGADAPHQPNQPYFVARARSMSFGATIFPENAMEVLDELGQAYESHRQACRVVTE